MNTDSNPYLSPEPGSSPRHSVRDAQRTSALAIVSLVSGILSFPMMCLCFLSIPFSLLAICCGHMSRGIIKRSNGRYSGIEMATFGVISGYISLGLVVAFLAFSLGTQDRNRRPVPVPVVTTGSAASEVLYEQAEAWLFSDTTKFAGAGNESQHGDARQLALHYSEALSVAADSLFAEQAADEIQNLLTPADTTGDLQSEGDESQPYRTYVQLNQDSCAILVYVPGLERFTDSARVTLRKAAWLTAQRTLDETLVEGNRMAVGIYSGSGLQHVLTGTSSPGEVFDAGLQNEDATPEELIEFFQPLERTSTVELPAESTQPETRIGNNPNLSELPLESESSRGSDDGNSPEPVE